MTKYEKIANAIRKRILSGEYPENTLLPNQTDFVEEFGASRMTVKKAINILMMEGLIYSQRGIGTRVLRNHALERNSTVVTEYGGLTESLGEKITKSESLRFNVTFPNELQQEKLKIGPEHPIYEILRLRYVDGEPYVLEHTFMPTDLVPHLTTEIIEKSIYAYLKELKLEIAGAYRTILADKPSELDQTYLDCQPDDPVLEVEQVVYLKNSRPLEYSRSRNRYDKNQYTILDVM